MQKKYTLILFVILSFLSIQAQDLLFNELADKITFVVAKDGTGDFTTVQEAIDAVPNRLPTKSTIYIKNGTYREKISISSSKYNLTIIGQNVDSTYLTFDRDAGIDGFGNSSFKVSSTNFLALNLTIENSYGVGSQALALSATGDKEQFAHCRFIGFQDTYYSGTSLRNYFKDCLIIGVVDYIFGNTTVLFDSCQIHTLRDHGYLTAAKTDQRNRFGYVFNNCWVTGKYGVKDVFLGRPWGGYANVSFLNCYLGSCVSPLGWDNWGNPDNEATVKYSEYNNYGPGADISGRVSWSSQLNSEDASVYVMDTIFGLKNTPSIRAAWVPTLETDTIYNIMKKYFMPFIDPINTEAKLSAVKVNGVDISGFNPDEEELEIVLPSGTKEWPILEAIPKQQGMSSKIIYPDNIPGSATIIVGSKYEAKYKTYTVNIKLDETLTFEMKHQIPYLNLNQNITDCVTALDDVLQDELIRVYPNPSNGIFSLSIQNDILHKSVTIQIYNIFGQKIYSNISQENELEIDLSGFPKGQYFIKVDGMQRNYCTKVLLK